MTAPILSYKIGGCQAFSQKYAKIIGTLLALLQKYNKNNLHKNVKGCIMFYVRRVDYPNTFKSV